MRLAVLLCMPAWCHGEAAHAKAEAESLSRTLSGFQKYTDSLVEEYKNNAKSTAHLMVPADPAMAGTIGKIIRFINDFFVTAEAAHYSDEEASLKCSDNTCFGDCSFGAQHTTDVIVAEWTQLQKALNDIKNCVADNSGLIQEHSASCTAWDSFRVTAPPLPSCMYLSSTGSDDFCNNDQGDFCDERIKANEADFQYGGADQLEAMEDCLELTHDWMESMWEVFNSCNPRGNTGEQNLVCQDKVTAYHEDHCEYTMVVSDDCKKYDTCVDRCDDNCKSTCERVEIKKNARMADNETGERIKCLLAALVDEVGDNVTNTEETKTAKQDALAACINDDAITNYTKKASFFEITCASTVNDKVYPEGVNCAHRDQPVSCSTDYMEKLMNSPEEGVPQLKDHDQKTQSDIKNQFWNSCACGHQCTAMDAEATFRGGSTASGKGEDYDFGQGHKSYFSEFCGH